MTRIASPHTVLRFTELPDLSWRRLITGREAKSDTSHGLNGFSTELLSQLRYMYINNIAGSAFSTPCELTGELPSWKHRPSFIQ